MKNYLIKRGFFNILLLITLAGFLIYPKDITANNLENITLKETEKYLELPEKDVQNLLFTLNQVFTTDWIYRESSGFSTQEECLVPLILRKIIRIQVLNHLLVDAPIEITQKIIRGAIDVVRIYYDPSVFWEKFEKFTVERAIEEAKKQLFQKEIRVTPGAIEFNYTSQKGEERKVIFQYILIYQPLDAKQGKLVIRFYSPDSIEPPKNKMSIGGASGVSHSLTSDLSPFLLEIVGNVEKNELSNYSWIKYPSIKITFPEEVPDLGIRPLSFWERQIWKPIITQIKEIEILITKVTGRKVKVVEKVLEVPKVAFDVWNEIKAFLSRIHQLQPATTVQTQKVKKIPEKQETKESKKPKIEVEKGQEKELSSEETAKTKKLTLKEAQEILDDFIEKVDIISAEADKLIANQEEVTEAEESEEIEGEIEEEAEEESEKEIEEETKEEEMKEKTEEKEMQKLCQKIPGSYPLRNKIIFNEIAWMGTKNSSSNEWIELKNISQSKISLAGWQILNKNTTLLIFFNKGGQISSNGFYLLERTDDETLPGITADLIYTGAIKNSDEVLYLFDENCQLQDEVFADSNWPAGNNSSKRTMERKNNMGWQTSAYIGGTPKKENSSGYVEIVTAVGEGWTPPPSQFFPVIINEIMYSLPGTDDGREWIEIFNTGMSEVDLTNWKFYENETNHKLTLIQGTATLSANGYAVIADNTEKFLTDWPNYSGILFDSTFSLSNTGEKIAIKNGDLIIDEVNYQSSWGANGDGNSLQKFDSQWLAVLPTPGGKNEIPPPILGVSTTALSFEAIKDVKSPKPQSLVIQNLGGSDLNWEISSPVNWLKFDKSEGTISSNSSSTIKVAIDINGLTAGNYNTTFNIEAPGAQGSSTQISVSLIVYQKKFAKDLVISEVKISGEEFVEIFNPKEEEISTQGLYLAYFSKDKNWSDPHRVWEFPTSTISAKKDYFLIRIYGYSTISDWQLTTQEGNPYSSGQLADNSGAIGIFSCHPEKSGENCKIDLVGWGEVLVKEGEAAEPAPEEKSLGRKIAIDDEEKLNYLDLDNNRLDFEIQTPTPGEQNENLKPTAKFDFSPEDPYVGDNISFNASASADPDGQIVSYIWDFGDGNSTTTNSASLTYFYSTSSDFTISLSVVDDLGATSTATTSQISVSSRQPLSVVINEISWMGTKASSSDEWIEFYNNTTSTIDIINWSIFGAKTGNCLNFSDANGFLTTKILSRNFLIYADRQESIQNLVEIWDNKIEIDDSSPDQLRLYDAPNCQGDLIDVVGEENSGWFFGDATSSISMERISATTTGATSTNWANNNLIVRFGKDAEGNNINGTPKSENSVSKSETRISSPLSELPFDEFNVITFTYHGSPYIIGNTIYVFEGKTLKIEPGVIIKFDSNQGIEVMGALEAIGKSEKEIIFTSSSGDGYWSGIKFRSATSETEISSNLEHIKIKKARICFGPGISCDVTSMITVDQSAITFKNSIIERDNSSMAIRISNSSSIVENVIFSKFDVALHIKGGSPLIKNCSFSKNHSGIYIDSRAAPRIEKNEFENNEVPISLSFPTYPAFSQNQTKNNKINGISISGGIIATTTLSADLPYVTEGFSIIKETLSLEPGVIIKFKGGALNINNGKLVAEGNKENPIVFTSLKDDDYGGDTNNDGTSTYATSSDWGNIHFYSTSSISALNHVIIRYGGRRGTPWWMNLGVITLEKDVLLEIKNSKIEKNVYAFSAPDCETIDNIKIDNIILESNEYLVYPEYCTLP